MEIKFANSFFESLEKIVYRRRIHIKIYDFFRYDLPNFFRNLWIFRKNLWNHTWYNGSSSILPWVKTAVDDMAWRIEKNGHEEEKSRLKKVAKMRRLSYLIDICVNEKFVDIAEVELGKMIHHEWEFEQVEGREDLYQLKDKETPEEKEHNRKVLKRSHEIQKQYWEELCHIIKGPDYDKISELEGDFEDHYDGSDIRAWWD
jgi:hypothetical protein